MTVFKPAVRRQAKLRLAITGPSGSGKTYSALLLASGIGDKIAVIDTENSSASLYTNIHPDIKPFSVLELGPPYTIQKYLDAIKAAEQEGFDVLIIDSISHAWAGEGGLLDKKSALDARGKSNQFSNWQPISKEHEAFKSAILNSNIHIIATMRSKQDYQVENENGKLVPKKLGLAPIQREGMEYEFTVVFDMAMDHTAMVLKDRTAMFNNQIFVPSKQTGELLKAWLDTGEAIQPKAAPAADQKLTYSQMQEKLKEAGMTEQEFMAWLYPAQKNKKYVGQDDDGYFWADDSEDLLKPDILQRAINAYKSRN